jgi:phosphatidylglycerophosphate synthase
MSESGYKSERRPIATRNYSVSIHLARWVAAKGITPNSISVAGMFAGLASGIALGLTGIVEHAWLYFLCGAGLMQLRLLANMLDGMVAVQTDKASPVGELFNEVPDRISDAAIFIGAGYAAGSHPELGFWAALAAVFTAYVRAEGKVAGAHQEFCGPMAKPQRMALLTVATLYAGIAPQAWQIQISSLPTISTIGTALILIAVGSGFTAVRRLRRVADSLQKENS